MKLNPSTLVIFGTEIVEHSACPYPIAMQVNQSVVQSVDRALCLA